MYLIVFVFLFLLPYSTYPLSDLWWTRCYYGNKTSKKSLMGWSPVPSATLSSIPKPSLSRCWHVPPVLTSSILLVCISGFDPLASPNVSFASNPYSTKHTHTHNNNETTTNHIPLKHPQPTTTKHIHNYLYYNPHKKDPTNQPTHISLFFIIKMHRLEGAHCVPCIISVVLLLKYVVILIYFTLVFEVISTCFMLITVSR